MTDLRATQITNGIWWVGALDWNVRNFHGYTTNRGTTYNAYLVIDEKVTLFDTVKKGFGAELLSRIGSVIDPTNIDYIVSNHAEPDHSGELSAVIDAVNPEQVFASKMGVKNLTAHYPELAGKITAVENGGELSLGKRTVQFMETRMLHWPDSMFSYFPDDELLISQDAFGMHVASGERFDDQIPTDMLMRQAASYYANIITLYSPQVSRLLKKVTESGLKISMIAPDHGPVWRDTENIEKLLSAYTRWSAREIENKAVIVYDTMWHATEKMARQIEDTLITEGIHTVSMSLSSCERSEVADEMLDAAAVIVGSPTLNNTLFPSCADVLTYLSGLTFKTPFAASFGSFGWSGEAVKQVDEYLEKIAQKHLGSVRAKYVPDKDVKEQCAELGATVAENVRSLTAQKQN